ncbi:hypothetical protein BpHYR1_024509 [Brachionus plicatilis]|uniref:Uncharacterized protein n=1 Tax=Brachionus plicatilis TaxID=10195 RepID=A0A3M7QLD5_BRAPC|nr:hypothetical protein BpHYR1_024509 [Brachionus plicatilis]
MVVSRLPLVSALSFIFINEITESVWPLSVVMQKRRYPIIMTFKCFNAGIIDQIPNFYGPVSTPTSKCTSYPEPLSSGGDIKFASVLMLAYFLFASIDENL